jgi:hypothetical protein
MAMPESNKTQKFVLRSALRPIQISFSHDQDPLRKPDAPKCSDAQRATMMWQGVILDPKETHEASRVCFSTQKAAWASGHAWSAARQKVLTCS